MLLINYVCFLIHIFEVTHSKLAFALIYISGGQNSILNLVLKLNPLNQKNEKVMKNFGIYMENTLETTLETTLDYMERALYIYFLPLEVIDGLKTLHKKKNNRERNVQCGRRLFLPDLF